MQTSTIRRCLTFALACTMSVVLPHAAQAEADTPKRPSR
jgi:hypothetical protein